ncbi:sulfurtransferase [Neotamlana laminarinivorans]|uniref:Sulfurtransferase n=1 Tax=Neotamlana laminarinivorans TaxID=2883124 RepID=A0A9X1HXF4_9FLAO|nr:rhodanese-like domain-containing protein [Tamlana laminarinivorans]MCB4797551.1 sulfurtransferase [Tamlana laminarinivorans]
MELNYPVVSVNWLNDNLNDTDIVVLDGTIAKIPNPDLPQITSARFFDIKQKFSDTTNEFPSAFPSETKFQEEARNLGINISSAIVVYDDKGIYSSARVWYLFKAFGFNNVAILNGGLPEWLKSKYPIEPSKLYSGKIGDFDAKLQPGFMQFFNDVKTASENKTHNIIDARSVGRFNCEVPEPREGLRSGTIPNSINLPFTNLIENGLLKSKEAIKLEFSRVAQLEDSIIFSCGSGITACVLALGAEIAGYKNVSVYDGSWKEWGSLVE